MTPLDFTMLGDNEFLLKSLGSRTPASAVVAPVAERTPVPRPDALPSASGRATPQASLPSVGKRSKQ